MDHGFWGGWSKAFWMKFGIVGCAVFIITPLLGYLLGFKASDAILWGTGLVLLAYTIETQAMRLEIVRQNEIGIQPLVITSIEERGSGRQLILKNIGRGPTLFIQVKDLESPGQGEVCVVVKFLTVDCIEAGKDAAVSASGHINAVGEVGRGFDFVAHLYPRRAQENHEVTILYEDIQGQHRESVMRMGKDGVRLLIHGKVRSR